MLRAHAVADVRAAEAALMRTLPAGTLMQRASAGLAAAVARTLGSTYGRRVVLLVGAGGNGGDTLWAGAFLARRGARVDAVLADPDRAHADGLHALLAAGGRVAASAADVVPRCDVVLDGLVGIGASPGLRGTAAALVADLEPWDPPVIAVDLPSGIDPDTGEAPGPHLSAVATVTFGTAAKAGLLVDPGAEAAGRVSVVDIGLEAHLPQRPLVEALEDDDVHRLLPVPHGASDKYSRGVVGVVSGSSQYPGAAVLSAGAALHGGAGMVRYLGPDDAADQVRARWPEVVVGEGRVQAWTVGSGLGDDRGEDVAMAVGGGVPVLVDADGLRWLPERFDSPALLTPHAGELSRLMDVDRADVEARRLHHARAAAARFGATVLLKGSTTVVADPDGRVRVNRTGTPWLASAGTGDVLSGLAGSLLAAGLAPLDAGSVAAYVHGLAGRLAAERSGAPTAQDVLAALPAALLRLRVSSGRDICR